MQKVSRVFNFIKFFLLLINIIIFVWIFFNKDFDRFLLNFIFITTIGISAVEILLDYINGLQTGVFAFRSMPFVMIFWFSFLLVTEVFFIPGGEGSYNKILSIFTISSPILIFLYFLRSYFFRLRGKRGWNIRPYAIISLSFLILIFLGSVLLYLPFSNKRSLSYIDSLFTATSAVCVTGLTVISVNNDLTLTGKIILLILIQIGGLGLMVFTALFSYLLGEKLTVFERMVTQTAISAENLSTIYRFTSFIVTSTLLIEVFGAFIFFIKFGKLMPLGDAVFYSIFHSISAFCNAGFSLYDNSFVNFRGDLLINLNLMGLIILGGIGFPVTYNIVNFMLRRERKLTLHTKIVLITTFILIMSGGLIYFLLEFDNILKNLSIKEKILSVFFASVTARTAGFNTIDYNLARDATLIFTCFLMFVGASPGSTGGGIKTTSLALVFLNSLSVLRNRKLVSIFNREISFDSIRKATLVLILGFLFIFIQLILFLVAQPEFGLSKSIFEIFSAFGTVGLSTGITPKTNIFGKIILITTMFFGRVGAITIIFSLGIRPTPILKRLPEEKVITG